MQQQVFCPFHARYANIYCSNNSRCACNKSFVAHNADHAVNGQLMTYRTADMITKVRTPGQVASQKKAAKTLRTHGHHCASAATGHLAPGEIFTVKAFIDRMGTTRSGLLEMRKRGLKARRDGGRVRILADDYLEYLKNQPVAELDDAT